MKILKTRLFDLRFKDGGEIVPIYGTFYNNGVLFAIVCIEKDREFTPILMNELEPVDI